jgi:iron complex transport system substrate-binding protein
VPEIVALAGGRELLGKARQPSFRATWDDVRGVKPEVVILAPCGFGAEETLDRAEMVGRELIDTPANRAQRVFAVDANAYFSRPGPRVVDAVALLAGILHPDRPPGFDVPSTSDAYAAAAYRYGAQSPQ